MTLTVSHVDVMLSSRTQAFWFRIFLFPITYLFLLHRYKICCSFMLCFLFCHSLFSVSNAVRIFWIVFKILHCLLLFLYSPKDVWHFVMYMKIHSNISKGLSVLLSCDQQSDVQKCVIRHSKKVCVALNPQKDTGLTCEREHRTRYFLMNSV